MSSARFQFDLEVVIGDDQPVELIFYDEDADGVKTPEDLDDRNWFYTAKSSHTDADADAVIALNPADILVDADGNATLNPTNVKNRLTFILPHADTALLTARNYGQDLQSVEKVGGLVFTKGVGTLTAVKDYTDRTA